VRNRYLATLALLTASVALPFSSPFAQAIALGPQAATPVPQPAATQSTSSVIAEIHATGTKRYTDAQVAAASGLKTGDAVTREQLQAAADELAHLGAFERVGYRFAPRGTKIAVEFQLVDAPAFPLLFDNFPWFSDSDIATAIRDAVPLFNGTVPQDGAELDDITTVISKLLKSHNVTGSVEHTLLAQPTSETEPSRHFADFPGDTPASAPAAEAAVPMVMQFRVEGPPITIGSIEFGDSMAAKSEKVHEHENDLVGKPYSRFAIEMFEAQYVRPLYLSLGQVRVRFDEPRVRVTSDGGQPQASAGKVSVMLPITPGPVFRFSEITWTGNKLFPETALTNALGIKPGEIVTGDKLDAAWQRIEKEYTHRGYVDAKIDPQPQFADAAATVSYHVAITEGPQYRMGELVITGLSLTAERIVRSFWRVAPGDVFDGGFFEEMLTKLEKPSSLVFGELPVHYTEMGRWLRRNPEMQTADVLLDFK